MLFPTIVTAETYKAACHLAVELDNRSRLNGELDYLIDASTLGKNSYSGYAPVFDRAGVRVFYSNGEWQPFDKSEQPAADSNPPTNEALLAWAEEEVRKEPTRSGTSSIPNTVALVLADVLQSHCCNSVGDYSKSELLERLCDWAWNGTKGYRDYTVDEALRDLREVIDDELAFDTMGEFLTHFELKETP